MYWSRPATSTVSLAAEVEWSRDALPCSETSGDACEASEQKQSIYVHNCHPICPGPAAAITANVKCCPPQAVKTMTTNDNGSGWLKLANSLQM